jgi:hypothetical protein
MHNSHSVFTDQISEEIARRVMREPSLTAFSKTQVSFLTKLSKEILNRQENRGFPDLITFGYFIRPSNIEGYLSGRQSSKNFIATGVGTAIHVAPSNIPINFAFSWLFGFIAGCKNLVRLPSAHSEQIRLFLEAFERTSSLPEFADIRKTNYFFHSERESAALDGLVPQVDALIVWGGDSTVEYFRGQVKSANVRQIFFPSRQSSMILKASAVLGVLESENSNDFLRNCYNDTFLTDCNACSSPSKIFFVGAESDCTKASSLFFSKLNDFVLGSNRSIPVVPRMMDSLGASEFSPDWGEATSYGISIREFRFKDGQTSLKRPLRFGAFLVKNLPSVGEVTAHLSHEEQTIIHGGFSEVEVLDLGRQLSSNDTNATRLVPLGSALDMGFFWEGRDNPLSLVRYFEVVPNLKGRLV